MSFCKDCVTGVTHDGEPVGQIEKINGVDTYIGIPAGDYDKTKAVLYLPDIFGVSKNAKAGHNLLVDDFAKNGYQTYLPDVFNGKPFVMKGEVFDSAVVAAVEEFLKPHGREQTRPIIDKVVEGLKAKGVTSFAATGYCFGGRYVFDLAFDNVIDVASVAHPSALEVPEDLEKIKASGVPLHMSTCEFDGAYGFEKQKSADEILGGGKAEAEKYKRDYYAGCTHGFAVRGDLSDPLVKKGKEGAFENAVHWFKAHL